MADNQTTDYPAIKGAVAYAGDIRRHFDGVSNDQALTSEERLSMIIRFVSYPLSELQRYKVLRIIEEVLPKHGNLYSLCYRLKEISELEAFGNSCLARFQFIDKTTDRWSLIYAVIAIRTDRIEVAAEFGLTREPHPKLIARLNKQITTEHRTKIGGFIFGQAACRDRHLYMMPLECSYGDLDDIGTIKDRWRNAGLDAGVKFPERPYRADFIHPGPVRFWPPLDYVRAIGFRIGEPHE